MGRDIAVQVGDGRVGSGEEGEGLHGGSREREGGMDRRMEVEGAKIGFQKGKFENEKKKLREDERRILAGEFVHSVSIFVPWPPFPVSEKFSVLSIDSSF